MAFPGGLCIKESACNEGYLGSIPGLGSSPGEGQYSGLENSMDCIVQGVSESWTWLSNFHFTLSCIARCRQSESIFFCSLWDQGLILLFESRNVLLISSALARVKTPSGLWHLILSLVSNTVASFRLFVILHGYYNGNWKKRDIRFCWFALILTWKSYQLFFNNE